MLLLPKMKGHFRTTPYTIRELQNQVEKRRKGARPRKWHNQTPALSSNQTDPDLWCHPLLLSSPLLYQISRHLHTTPHTILIPYRTQTPDISHPAAKKPRDQEVSVGFTAYLRRRWVEEQDPCMHDRMGKGRDGTRRGNHGGGWSAWIIASWAVVR